MQLPKIPIEEYLILSLSSFLRIHDPASVVSLISGDPDMEFVPQDDSINLRLAIYQETYFKMSFSSHPTLLDYLSMDDHLNLYFSFFYPVNNLEATIINDSEPNAREALIMSFEILFMNSKYDLKIAIYDVEPYE